jgi:prepilin-type N-terminal cleavage/methylation domain-containing protein
MKTTKGDRTNGVTRAARSLHVSRLTFHVSGFTLIELLAVIGIIGVLAGFLLVVAGPVKKKQYIYNTQAEMAKLETAIDNYKAAYGFYPPGATNSLVNQLYYELVGTTNTSIPPASPVYQTLNGSTTISAGNVLAAFGVGGFMNCSKPNGGEDASAAKDFLPDLRPNQVWVNYNTNSFPTEGLTLLVTAVRGPDATYKPLGVQDLNPWRYNSSNPANNPGSYDLWILLSIAGKTNLICNWSKQVQVVTNGWIN